MFLSHITRLIPSWSKSLLQCFLTYLFQYPNHPLAIYQVSGEYAMLYHGAQAGAFELRKVLMETLTSMRRAGESKGVLFFSNQIITTAYIGTGQIDSRHIPRL